jgi:hypothetical protein
MKRLSSLCAVVCIALFLTPAVHAQSSQIQPGTQVRLTLLNGLSTSVARDGDPFTAIVAEPVMLGTQMVLPAGAKVHGTVTSVTHPKWFGIFRGGASMNLVFNSIEVESRIFPAQMSILALSSGGADGGKPRKDVKTTEGVVVQEKRDIKRDLITVSVGTSAGTIVGAIFSDVTRGTVIGLAGTGAYIMTKKGKDVELPAQTGILVRMDSTVSVPGNLMHNASYTTSGQ